MIFNGEAEPGEAQTRELNIMSPKFPAGCSPRGRIAAACAEPGPAGRNLHTLRFRRGRLRRVVEGRVSSPGAMLMRLLA